MFGPLVWLLFYKCICPSYEFILSFLLKSLSPSLSLMSDSNETTPLTPDWPPFYQQNAQPQHPIFSAATNQLSFSTAVAAAEPSSSHGLTPEGRVAKPVRRRSRASRRTPTTVFNTDASNFRAMVQQFTGGGLTMPPPPPPFGMAFGPQHVQSLNVPPRAPSYDNGNNMHQFEQVQSGEAYSHRDHHLQAFLGRVSLNPSRGGEGGGGSSSDQNRNQTNYMLWLSWEQTFSSQLEPTNGSKLYMYLQTSIYV